MSRATTTERQPDRTLDWQALIETALTVEGSVGNIYNRFYNYSFLNQMYLRMQGVQEPIATYKRWQSLGRQVVKGAKAKEIVRPIVINKKNEAGEVEASFRRFKPVKCLFTVSETVGDDLPDVEIPTWNLATAEHELDITRVPFADLDGNTQGYSFGRSYAINPVAVRPAKTTMHEFGHIVLGHTTPDRLSEYQTHRGRFEFQAEATAHLTMNELDQLDPAAASESRGYIQHWLHGEERPSDTAIRQVFTATDAILKAGRPAVLAFTG